MRSPVSLQNRVSCSSSAFCGLGQFIYKNPGGFPSTRLGVFDAFFLLLLLLFYLAFLNNNIKNGVPSNIVIKCCILYNPLKGYNISNDHIIRRTVTNHFIKKCNILDNQIIRCNTVNGSFVSNSILKCKSLNKKILRNNAVKRGLRKVLYRYKVQCR